jgi:hypothetical protein
MADYEKPIARKVVNLLKTSDLDPDDPMLTEASASALAPHSANVSHDDLRSSAWLAIETLRKSIADKGSPSSTRACHRAAVAAAERWLNARS